MKVERMVERGRRETRMGIRRGSIESILSEDDMRSLLRTGEAESANGTATEEDTDLDVDVDVDADIRGNATGDEFEEAVVEDEKEGLLMAERKSS